MKTPTQLIRVMACVAALSCAAVTSLVQNYDLVILNGRVMDPETNLDATRNVGVKDGRIQVITSTTITGKQTIDAGGHVVPCRFSTIKEKSLRGMPPRKAAGTW